MVREFAHSSKTKLAPRASMPSQVLSRTEHTVRNRVPETKLVTYQSYTLPRMSRHTQVVSGTPLVMSPKGPQMCKSSHMILTSTQTVGTALGRSSQLTGTSLQMSTAPLKPSRASKLIVISKQVPNTPSKSLPHPMVYGTPLLMSKNAVPRYEASQMILTRTDQSQTSPQMAGVSLHMAKTGSKPNKPPSVADVSIQESRMAMQGVVRHTSQKSSSHKASSPVCETQSSQMIVISTSTSKPPGRRHVQSQSVSTSLPKAPSQLSGHALQMSSAASRACNPSPMILMASQRAKSSVRTQVPHKWSDRTSGPASASRQAVISTSTNAIVPSQMVGRTLHMTTLPLQFRTQKPLASAHTLAVSHANQRFQKSGKPLKMSA